MLLTMFGILESSNAIKNNVEDVSDISALRLASDAKDRYLVMVGDGLTQIRAKQFSDLIEESSASYGPRHETTMMIQKAMDQVIIIPGDLHGGGFHIMQVVYNLFYGAIIQKIQTILQWKRICSSNVSKCYQQAASLSTILAIEMEHHFTSEYFKTVDGLCEDKAAFNAIKDSREFTIYIAKGFTR